MTARAQESARVMGRIISSMKLGQTSGGTVQPKEIAVLAFNDISPFHLAVPS
jgi:hypothetical protein